MTIFLLMAALVVLTYLLFVVGPSREQRLVEAVLYLEAIRSGRTQDHANDAIRSKALTESPAAINFAEQYLKAYGGKHGSIIEEAKRRDMAEVNNR